MRLEAVDSNGLIPLAAHGKAFAAARFYRAFMQRELRDHVTDVPEEAPLAASAWHAEPAIAATEHRAAMAAGDYARPYRRR